MIFLRVRRVVSLALGFFTIASAQVHASGVPPLEVYGRLPETEKVAISPSGRRLAIVATVKDQRRLIVIEDNKVIFSSPFGDQKIRNLDWADEEKVLMRVSRTASLGWEFTAGKTEASSMIIVPIDKGPIWAIFERDKAMFAGIHGFWGLAGNNGFFGGIEASVERDGVHVSDGRVVLYKVNLETRAKSVAARQPDTASRDWQLGSDGSVVATLDFTSSQGDWEIRNSARKILASGRSPSGGVSLISLGRTPDKLLYFKRKDDVGDGMLIEQPLDGSPGAEILSDEGVANYIIDDRSRLFIGYVTYGDRQIHFFDPGRQKIIAAARKAFPGLNLELIGWSTAFDRLLVRTSGATDSGTWWLVDRTSKTANVVATAYPIEASDVAPIQSFDYKAQDGLEMSGVLTLPPGQPAKNLPVIILPHGGPQSHDDVDFDWWAQAFAVRGYAVLQPNFRGSTGFGRSFEQAGWGEWGRKMQTDISDGLAALAREGIVDPNRACIMGGSYGGYAALAGVTLQQHIYRCAVSVAGVSDVNKLIAVGLRESGDNAMLNRFYKRQIGTGRDLRAISPVSLATRADAPILLIHGVDDIVVPFDQSSVMAAALTRAGKPFEFVKLSGEDHWLSRGETRLAMLKAATAFIEKHNPPGPMPSR